MLRTITSALILKPSPPRLPAWRPRLRGQTEPGVVVRRQNPRRLGGRYRQNLARRRRSHRRRLAGGTTRAAHPGEFLCTTKSFGDFELKLKFKLLGDRQQANAGVQFRTKRIPNHHEVIGFQADIGQDYWGALYDESRRKKVLAQPDKELIEKLVKHDDWNEYVIRLRGPPRVRLWLNGNLTVDYTEKDDKIERAGIIGLQIHGGAKAKVYYKDIVIEELPAK